MVGGGWEEKPTGLNFKKRMEFPAINNYFPFVVS